MGVTRIMHNSPNRGVNYHIFWKLRQLPGNYHLWRLSCWITQAKCSTVPPTSSTRNGTQNIVNQIGPTGSQWISAAQELKTSMGGPFDKNSGPRPGFSKVVGNVVMGDPRVDVNSRCGMQFGSDSFLTPNSNFLLIIIIF